jgi:hypothetical protein
VQPGLAADEAIPQAEGVQAAECASSLDGVSCRWLKLCLRCRVVVQLVSCGLDMAKTATE